MPAYQPPFQLTHRMTALVADIAERLGAWKAANRDTLVPSLRRSNHIRTLQVSLAIEQNTLSVEQVTTVLAGRPVPGSPKGVQEVRMPLPPLRSRASSQTICCQYSANS